MIADVAPSDPSSRPAEVLCRMARILHLSDLHLGAPAQWQHLDDRKRRIIKGDRRAQKHVLRETLEAVLDDAKTPFDAVVISGDLTHQCKPDGFIEFAEIVDLLIESDVAPNAIVVVPGNHDVPWDPGPDADGRYDEFKRVTRDKELITPLLDRVDFREDGTLLPHVHGDEHLARGDDFVIVSVNSSHFCWGMEDVDEEFEQLLRRRTRRLQHLVDQLRRHDIARVSNAQIGALQHLLRTTEPKLLDPDADDDRVRIAVLHHQLLPIGTREEFKSFEGLSNLGAVRELLAGLGTHIVLHGHKHDSALYWDYVANHATLSATPHRMLVCAAPGEFKPEGTVLRIFDIGPRASARDVEAIEVQAARTSVGPVKRVGQRARLWASLAEDMTADGMSVRGATVSETYARIQSLFDSSAQPINDLVCEVIDPSGAGGPPVDYPKRVVPQNVEAWMADLVDWWQQPNPKLLGPGIYNHGERLYQRWGNQVARAADVLVTEPQDGHSTTRAVMLLIDPEHEASCSGVHFPSFVLIQLHLIAEGQVKRLDCTGYFRKQEMRFWWPINVAELAIVQQAVLKLIAEGLERTVLTGRLRTITGQALVEDRLPAVALPAIDRALDQNPDQVWRMAFGLYDPDQDDKTELRRIWEEYLTELDPGDAPGETPPTSKHGLPLILKYLGWLKVGDIPVAEALRTLVDVYNLAPDPKSVREPLAQQAARALAALREELDNALGGQAAS
jgi:3',5'-cyclic AMP phosphodiesterase CpdA